MLNMETVNRIDENTLDITHSKCMIRLSQFVDLSDTQKAKLKNPVYIDKEDNNLYYIHHYLYIPYTIEEINNYRVQKTPAKVMLSNTKPRSAIRWLYKYRNGKEYIYRIDKRTTASIKHKIFV